ncbi:MAG: hypothetical protein M3Q71_15190, partial [Chloroflexota bacterium]|nr:hypothetical protein [Chloroflexota bacterium]
RYPAHPEASLALVLASGYPDSWIGDPGYPCDSPDCWTAGRSSLGELTPMHHLRLVSIAMVLGGLLAVAASGLFALGPAWTLTGLLLAFAGAVKLIVVALWRGVASLSTPVETGVDEAQSR